MGNVYQNPNQIMVQDLVVIYRPNGYDWLHYQITKRNIITLHHVVKEADGGELTVGNSALLTVRAHRAVNKCESKDHVLYNEINDFFREIIAVRAPLDDYFIEQSKVYKYELSKILYPKHNRIN